MEADFLRYYGLRLWADLGTDRLRWRSFRALLVSLPPDSAYVRSVAGGEAHMTIDTQLLGLVVDALRMWLWGNADPKKRGSAPAPVLGYPTASEAPVDMGAALLEQQQRLGEGEHVD